MRKLLLLANSHTVLNPLTNLIMLLLRRAALERRGRSQKIKMIF